MDLNEKINYWKAEEEQAHIHGWDFSHIEGRYDTAEDTLPWDMTEVIRKYLRPGHRLLDIDTGGGEYLLSLGHPYEKTSATEGYPPNVALCKKTLGELGIDFHPMTDYAHMPFEDDSFDVIINRHGDYSDDEIYRVLKKGGIFITQQVGCKNDRELVELLLPEAQPAFGEHDLAYCMQRIKNAGFTVLESGEEFRPIEFYDTGALVWFARIIEWEFIGFSVEKCLDRLIEADRLIEQNGKVCGQVHRFYLAARK